MCLMLPQTLMGMLQNICKVPCIIFLKSKNILNSEIPLASRVTDKGTWPSDGKFGHGLQGRQPSGRTGIHRNIKNEQFISCTWNNLFPAAAATRSENVFSVPHHQRMKPKFLREGSKVLSDVCRHLCSLICCSSSHPRLQASWRRGSILLIYVALM